jgi:hypothetical protein
VMGTPPPSQTNGTTGQVSVDPEAMCCCADEMRDTSTELRDVSTALVPGPEAESYPLDIRTALENTLSALQSLLEQLSAEYEQDAGELDLRVSGLDEGGGGSPSLRPLSSIASSVFGPEPFTAEATPVASQVGAMSGPGVSDVSGDQTAASSASGPAMGFGANTWLPAENTVTVGGSDPFTELLNPVPQSMVIGGDHPFETSGIGGGWTTVGGDWSGTPLVITNDDSGGTPFVIGGNDPFGLGGSDGTGMTVTIGPPDPNSTMGILGNMMATAHDPYTQSLIGSLMSSQVHMADPWLYDVTGVVRHTWM